MNEITLILITIKSKENIFILLKYFFIYLYNYISVYFTRIYILSIFYLSIHIYLFIYISIHIHLSIYLECVTDCCGSPDCNAALLVSQADQAECLFITCQTDDLCLPAQEFSDMDFNTGDQIDRLYNIFRRL